MNPSGMLRGEEVPSAAHPRQCSGGLGQSSHFLISAGLLFTNELRRLPESVVVGLWRIGLWRAGLWRAGVISSGPTAHCFCC